MRDLRLKEEAPTADDRTVAVTSEPHNLPAGADAPGLATVSAVQRAAAAWGTDPLAPGRCPAEWRRPGEVWHCDRRHGHKWRHHYVRD